MGVESDELCARYVAGEVVEQVEPAPRLSVIFIPDAQNVLLEMTDESDGGRRPAVAIGQVEVVLVRQRLHDELRVSQKVVELSRILSEHLTRGLPHGGEVGRGPCVYGVEVHAQDIESPRAAVDPVDDGGTL